MKKTAILWLMLAVMMSLVMVNVCFAVDDEDGGFGQSKMLTLEGDEPPPPPKPRVIVKERVVAQCAPGSVWNTSVKRCISDGANDTSVPVARPQQAVNSDRYIYTGTKLRIKLVNCTLQGEKVSCALSLTNTAQGNVRPSFDNAVITDNFGVSYKLGDLSCKQYGGGCSWNAYGINYGASKTLYFVFPLVNPDTTALDFSSLANANGGSDVVKFSGIQLLK